MRNRYQPAVSCSSSLLAGPDRRLQLALYRLSDATGVDRAPRPAGTGRDRSRPAYESAVHRQRHHRRSPDSRPGGSGAGIDRIGPEASRGRCIRALPHCRRPEILSNARLDRGREVAAQQYDEFGAAPGAGRGNLPGSRERKPVAIDGAHPRPGWTAKPSPTGSRSWTCVSAAPTCRRRTARRSISACRPSGNARPPSSGLRARNAPRKSAREPIATLPCWSPTRPRQAEQTRGEGDATRNSIFADAFNKDKDFFSFYRSMQAYETAFQHNDTRMLLKPDSEFFRFFVAPSGKGAPSASSAAARVGAATGSAADAGRKVTTEPTARR